MTERNDIQTNMLDFYHGSVIVVAKPIYDAGKPYAADAECFGAGNGVADPSAGR